MGIKFEKKSKATAASEDDTPPFNDSQPAQDSAAVVKATKPKPAKKPKKVDAEAQAENDESLPKAELIQPMATVDVTHVTGVTETHVEAVGPPIMKTEPMANVGLSLGFTHGMPNYSNVKCSVSLFMPSKTDEASLAETFTFVEAWVDTRIGVLRDDLTATDED